MRFGARTMFCASALALCAAVAAHAEIVELADGRVFDGELVSETEEFLTIRQAAGDSFIDAVYEKSEVKAIGERKMEDEAKLRGSAPIVEKQVAGMRAVKSTIDFESRERVDYENAVKDISGEIRKLNSLWNINHHDYEGFRRWFARFSSLGGRFKEKYGSGSSPISFSMMGVVFQELGHFEESVRDMEKAEASYEKSVSTNASLTWRQRFQDCLTADERLAGVALCKAGDYAALVEGKICRR